MAVFLISTPFLLPGLSRDDASASTELATGKMERETAETSQRTVAVSAIAGASASIVPQSSSQ